MLPFLRIISLILLLGINSVCVAASGAPIVLRHADMLRTEPGSEGPVRFLDGNVWITHDTLSITCGHATYEEGLGRLFFYDNVHFVEPARQIWSDQATYYEQDGRAIAEGHVRIEQDSLIINCQRAVYLEKREEALFFGDVKIRSLREDAILTGNHGAYSSARNRGVLSQNPRLVRYFDSSDSLVVVGDVIEYFFDSEAATVTDNIHIKRGELNAWGDILYYKNSEEWARLVGNPRLKRGWDTMRADTIDAYFENRKIRRLHLKGKALATSPADSLTPEPFNRLTGQEMDLVFNDGQLDSIHVRGNATSVYYIREDGENKGVNRISGDVIDMWIQGDRISWIHVEGGTEGAYFPPGMEDQVESDRAEIPASRLVP